VKDFHLEHIARLGSLDINRAGQRVHHIQVRRGHGLQRGVRAHLPVKRVASLQDNLIPGLAMDHRRNVGMPAIVAGPRLLRQRLTAVDAYFPDSHRRLLGRLPAPTSAPAGAKLPICIVARQSPGCLHSHQVGRYPG
jgi:hypothetical protein